MKSLLSTLPEEDRVRKLIDYILLNAYSVNSTGLHNGKAGIALALFEIAKHFQDNYIEEQAIELLKESLLSKNGNICFEEGLSGIGYVLLYLIKNKRIEADFDKLFGKSLNKIISTLTIWKEKRATEQIFRSQNIVLFLDSIPDKNKCPVRFIELFSDTVKSVISDQINRSSQLTSSISKTNVLGSFSNYLKLATHCPHFKPSADALNRYMEAYREGRFVSDFVIGHHLHLIALKDKDKDMEAVAETNKYYGIRNLQVETMNLSARLDLLYILSLYKEDYHKQAAELEKGLFDCGKTVALEKSLSKSIPPASFMSGYQSGVSRFLLYWVYKQHVANQLDCTRFQNIF